MSELTDRNLNRHNLMPTNAVRVKPGILVKQDFYDAGGAYDPLAPGGGPESDFIPKRRDMWPEPTIGPGGTPTTMLEAGKYPMDPNAGMPKNTVPLKEGPSTLAERVDEQMRPLQLIKAERLALPLMPGEGRRYTQASNQPLDPSVIREDQMRARPTRLSFFGEGTFAPTRRRVAANGLAGLGIEISAPGAGAAASSVVTAPISSTGGSALAAVAMGPIIATMQSIRDAENTLKAMNEGVFQATVAPYAGVRSELDRLYADMAGDPSTITTNAILFGTSAATYKLALNTAIKKLNASQPKNKPATLLPALPGAVVKTATSGYGITVLAVGAAVVAGLLVVRAMQKPKRGRK